MEFVFEPSVKIRMRPAQYLFRMGSGSYCLGIFDNGSAGTLIGGISVRDVLVQVRCTIGSGQVFPRLVIPFALSGDLWRSVDMF